MPADFAASIVRDRKIGIGALGYLAAAFSFTFFVNFARGCGVFSFIAQTVMYFVLFVFAGILFAAVTQMFLDLAAGKGNAPGLFALAGISGFAQILLIAGAVICSAFGAGSGAAGLIFTLVFILQVVFLIKLTAKAYDMSAGAVFFSMLLTVMPSFAAAVLLVCAALAGIITLIFALAR